MHFLEDFKGDEPSHRQYLHNLNKWKKQFHEISQTDDSKNITECIIKFIEYVVNYTSGISCRSQILICHHSFALLQELVDDKFLNNFVEQATQRIFDIVIEEGKNTWCIKKEILKTFNNCLRNVKKDIRYQTASELSDIYLFKIIDSISSYGDYDLQVVIIETIFRMYGKATINARLKDLIPESQELSQSFAEINPERFDEDVRLFLNSLNKISGKIFSIQCDKVKIGDVICIPPTESIKGMWVDFNTWDSAITWYCNESSFREDLSDDDDIWNLITLFVSDVTTVSVHSAAGNPNIIVHCSLQSSCLSKFKDDQPILDQAKYLSLLLSKSEETDKLVDNILPQLFGNKLQKRPEARINCIKKISTPKTLEYKPLNITVRRRSESVGADGKLSVSMTTSYLDPFNMKSDDTAPSSRSSRAITITSSNSLSSSENDDFVEIPPIKILSGRCSSSSRDRGLVTPSKKVSISISNAQRSRKKKRQEAELNIASDENATISPEIFETAQYSAKSSESFQTAELDSQKTYVLNATKNEQNICRNYSQNGELPELTEDFSSLEVNIFQNDFVLKKVSCKTYVPTFRDNTETPRIECNDIEEKSEFAIGVKDVVQGNTREAIESPGFEERIILTGEILSDEHIKTSSELLNTKPEFRDKNESSNSSNSNCDSMKVNIFTDVGNIEKNRHTNANIILEENQISQDIKNLPLRTFDNEIGSHFDVNKDNILDKIDKGEELSSALSKELLFKECNIAKNSTSAERLARTEKYTLSVSKRRQTMNAIIKDNSTLSNDNNMNRVEKTKLVSVDDTPDHNLEHKSGKNIPEENEESESRKCGERRKKAILKEIEEDNTNKKCRGRPIKTILKGKGDDDTNKKCRGRPIKTISKEKGDNDTNKKCRGRPRKNIPKVAVDNENRKRRGRPRKNISGEKEKAVSSALFELSKDEFPSGAGDDVNQKRRGRPRKNISGQKDKAQSNRTEGNIEKNRHTNATKITKENLIPRDVKNLASHSLPNKWAANENISNEILIEKTEVLNSAFSEFSKDMFPKGTGNDEIGKSRGRRKQNISGEREEPEINRTKTISEGFKLDIGNEDSEHEVYNNVVQKNITCNEKLENIISETVIQKEVSLRHNKSAESADLEDTKRNRNSNENIKVVTEDNKKPNKSPTGSESMKDYKNLFNNIDDPDCLTVEMKNDLKLGIEDNTKYFKQREESTNTFEDKTNEEPEIIEFTANVLKPGNEENHTAVDIELESIPVVNEGALSNKISTKENMDGTKIFVVELQKINLDNKVRTISDSLNSIKYNKDTEHDTLEQEIFNHPDVIVCENKRNNEDIQSLHQEEVSEDDKEGDYSGRIHTETDPLPKVLIDPELAFETLFGKNKKGIVASNVIMSSCDDIQVVKETGSNLARNGNYELEQIIPDDVRTDKLSFPDEVEDNLNSIQVEKIIDSEHANNPEIIFELGNSDKIEQMVFDQKNVENEHQEDDQNDITNNIGTSQVVVEPVENVTDLMKNDEIHDHLKSSRINRVRFSNTSQDQANDDARKLAKMQKTDLDANLVEKSTNLIHSIDANQTVSTTQSVQRMRKLYNPDDFTDLENMSLLQDESLLQKEKNEIPSLITNNSGLKVFKKCQENVIQSWDNPIISRRNWNATSTTRENEKKDNRKLTKGEISYRDVKQEEAQMQEIIRKRKSSDTNHRAKRARKSSLHSLFSDMVGGLREELRKKSLKKNEQEDFNIRKRTSSSKKNNIVVKETNEKINKYRKSEELKRPKNKKPLFKSKTLPLPDSSSSSSVKSRGFNKPKYNEPSKISKELPLVNSPTFPKFSIRKEKQYDNNIRPETNFDIHGSPMNIEEKSNMRHAAKNKREKINILSNITIHPRMSEEGVQPSKRSRILHQSYVPDIIHNENHVKDVYIHRNSLYPSYLGTKVSKPAPLWESIAVLNGEFVSLKSTDYLGKYLVLLFYPLDFASVYQMEILAFNKRIEEFQRIDTEVVGCSIDSHFVHSAWINTRREDGGLGKINFPLLSDLKRSITKVFGVYMEDLGHSLRGLVIIDGKGIIRQITMNDLPVGSSVNETLRLVQEFQNADKSISEPN